MCHIIEHIEHALCVIGTYNLIEVLAAGKKKSLSRPSTSAHSVDDPAVCEDQHSLPVVLVRDVINSCHYALAERFG